VEILTNIVEGVVRGVRKIRKIVEVKKIKIYPTRGKILPVTTNKRGIKIYMFDQLPKIKIPFIVILFQLITN
jgi:hypothetical protein